MMMGCRSVIQLPAGFRNFNVGIVLADCLLRIRRVKAIESCSNDDDKDETELFVLAVSFLNFPLKNHQITVHLSIVIIFIRIDRVCT